MGDKMKIIVIVFLAITLNGCGKNELCAEQEVAMRNLAEATSSFANGTGTAARGRYAAEEALKIVEKIKAKGIDCK
jgi:hypothetical protein